MAMYTIGAITMPKWTVKSAILSRMLIVRFENFQICIIASLIFGFFYLQIWVMGVSM